ncbi:MAG TPA: hypothetical protein VG455_16385 [Acidimicrobiales bacterium]|nr:hypothetical protein [Acidimicrobiales bacterium]
MGEILAVLDERVGVAEPLEDDALRFLVVEVGVVLQRPRVLGADDLHALRGQPLNSSTSPAWNRNRTMA